VSDFLLALLALSVAVAVLWVDGWAKDRRKRRKTWWRW
jgi:hypothetical protein